MSPPRLEWPGVLVAGYLVLQLGWIVTVPWHHDRTLAWAPLHEQVRYQIDVRRDGRDLSRAEVAARYGHGLFYNAASGEDWQLNELQRITDVIERTEHQRSDGAVVVLRYSRNGRSPQEWQWPPP